MQGALYDAVAFGMRYWFLLLIALMLFTLIGVSVSEYRRHKSVMSMVGQFIGYIEITGGDEESIGLRIGLTKENLIGSSKRADILIDDSGIQRSHAVITHTGKEIILAPVGNAEYRINGRLASKPHPIYDGDVLTFGSVEAVVHFSEEAGDDA